MPQNLHPSNFLLIQLDPNVAIQAIIPNGIVSNREWNLSNPRPETIKAENVAKPVFGIPVVPTK